MASDAAATGLYALGLAIRAALMGLLSFAAVTAVAIGRDYAVSVVLVLLMLVIAADLWRTVNLADRALEGFINAVAVGERVGLGPGAALPRFRRAADRAGGRLTEQRLALQRRLDHLQALCDSVPAALIAVGPDGSAVFANRAAQRLAGVPLARLADAAGVGPEVARRLEALPAGGREIVTLPDGREALVSANELRTPGETKRRLLSLQDISALDPVELKAWRDLSRVLAHEIMNSLTPIASLAESLREHAAQPSEIASALEVIERRSLGLMAFVDRYRQVAQAPHAILEPVALAPLVAAVDRLMTPAAEAVGVNYESRVEPVELQILADRDLIEQAIINLLRNGIEAVAGSSEAGVRLTCRGADDRVEITVEDNGPGVADENRARIFVPFFTTKASGSGIGLTIARQIAAAHNGRLEVLRSEWLGAAFRLTLPLGHQSQNRQSERLQRAN